VKRGWLPAFTKFDEYALGKYNRASGQAADVLFPATPSRWTPPGRAVERLSRVNATRNVGGCSFRRR